MNPTLRRTASTAANTVFTVLLIYFLIRPDRAAGPVADGIVFCARSVVPSLFIFMVLSRRVISSPSAARACARPVSGTALIVIIGIVCGFPTGAKLGLMLYERGAVSKRRAEYLCAVGNNASAGFIAAFAGKNVLGSTEAGFRLLAVELCAAAVTAAFLYPVYMKGEACSLPDINLLPAGNDITEAVGDSAITMVKICGFVITFSLFGGLAASLLPEGTAVRALVTGLFEFSGGIAAIKGMSPGTAFPLCALLLGFGSLSVIMQTAAIIREKLSMRPFLLARIITASLMSAFALIS